MNKLSNLHYLNKLGVTPKAVRNWTPSALGSALQFWGDANTGSSLTIQNQASLQTISQMNDISGNARHLTQATSTAQPRLVRGRSNLLDYSQEFNLWGNAGVNVATNVAKAPDGTMTADTYAPSGAGVYINKNSSYTTAGVTYTYSIFAKDNGLGRFYLFVGGGGNNYGVDFNTVTGEHTPGSVGPYVSAYGSIPYPDGWYRFWMTTSAPANPDWLIHNVTAPANPGISSIFLWGALVTEGSTLEPYIGYNGLWTDGVDDWMETSTFTLSQPFTRFSVITRQNAVTSNPGILNSRTGGSSVILEQGTTNNAIRMSRGTTVTSGQTFSRLQTSVFGEVYNGSSSLISNNGTTTAGTVDSTGGSGLLIGATSGSTGFSQNIIHEVVIVSGVLPTLQRQRVEGYLAWKWGIREQLPTTHPYRHIRPTL